MEEPHQDPCLSNVRVLDFSILTPGPFASQALADLGATVLKVERPGTGDLERLAVPAYFRGYNRGKASIAIDLRSAEGIAQAKALIATADVVINGFRPGVLQRLGLGFDVARQIKPDLVYVSINGMGSTGPYAQDRGHDSEFMARCGALDPAGRSSGIPAYDNPMPVSDYAAAFYAVIGVLGELGRPQRKSIHLEVPIMGAGLAWMFPKILREIDEAPHRIGARVLPGVGCFQTRDGRWVTVTAVEDHIFADLARAIGQPQLASDPQNATYAQRRANATAINAAIANRIATQEFNECMAAMRQHDVCCAPVNSAIDALEDPQVKALGIIHDAPSPHADMPLFGAPTVRRVRAPELDEDGDFVRANGWEGLTQRLEQR